MITINALKIFQNKYKKLQKIHRRLWECAQKIIIFLFRNPVVLHCACIVRSIVIPITSMLIMKFSAATTTFSTNYSSIHTLRSDTLLDN